MSNGQLNRSSEMTPVSEARLWKTLDGISSRLGGIESKLNDIGRLEERVKAHDLTLSRYGNRLDEHDSRMRSAELWQANFGDRSRIEHSLSNIKKELDEVRGKVDSIESYKDVNNGQKDVVKEILKWLSVILSGILIYKITRG